MVSEVAIKYIEKAIKHLQDAAMETQNVADWKWRYVLKEKKSDLIRLMREMERESSTI